MRTEKIHKLMNVADAISKLSTCGRQVGCVLVDGLGHIKATGYNGPPQGMGSCACTNRVSGEDLDICPAVHAEMNALMQCADTMQLYMAIVTTKPCLHCIKMLMNTSITHIYYRDTYPHEGVQKLWQSLPGRVMLQIPCK